MYDKIYTLSLLESTSEAQIIRDALNDYLDARLAEHEGGHEFAVTDDSGHVALEKWNGSLFSARPNANGEPTVSLARPVKHEGILERSGGILSKRNKTLYPTADYFDDLI